MAALSETITAFVAGDDLEITYTITSVPGGQTLTQAWLTVKTTESALDSAALIQKVITAVDVPGTGQITDTGADGTGAVRFDLGPADTVQVPSVVGAIFDIQVKTSAGKLYTAVKGTIGGVAQVTLAT